MTSAELESNSAAATESAAGAVGRALRAGDFVLVSGDVGTGKTTFVRGASRALGVREPVTSPSFTIGHRYEGTMPVSHVDLFRLDSLEGEDPGLLADYTSPEGVTFVEWPQEAVPELDPERVVLRVHLEHLGGDRRGVRASGDTALVRALREALLAARPTA
jgi:tRNA threonylcarbamoyladenosine biosynthesis protein TsaE